MWTTYYMHTWIYKGTRVDRGHAYEYAYSYTFSRDTAPPHSSGAFVRTNGHLSNLHCSPVACNFSNV